MKNISIILPLILATTAYADLTSEAIAYDQLHSIKTSTAPVIVNEFSNTERAFFGEQHVDAFYRRAGRSPLLDKFHPNETGPDSLYRLRDGSIQLSEVKTYSGWAGHKALNTEVAGKPMQQLSDEWVNRWCDRAFADELIDPKSASVAREVQQAMREGKLVRTYDEVNIQTGEWRSSTAITDGGSKVKLSERMGPVKINRLELQLTKAAKRLEELKIAKNGNPISNGAANTAKSPRASIAKVANGSDEVASGLSSFGKVVSGIAILGGGYMVIDGSKDIALGNPIEGSLKVTEGSLIVASGSSFLVGQVALGVGLGGAAACVDGSYDIYLGVTNDDLELIAIGTVKLTAGSLLIAGAATANPILIAVGGGVYILCVGYELANSLISANDTTFTVDQIEYRTPKERESTEWANHLP